MSITVIRLVSTGFREGGRFFFFSHFLIVLHSRSKINWPAGILFSPDPILNCRAAGRGTFFKLVRTLACVVKIVLRHASAFPALRARCEHTIRLSVKNFDRVQSLETNANFRNRKGGCRHNLYSTTRERLFETSLVGRERFPTPTLEFKKEIKDLTNQNWYQQS